MRRLVIFLSLTTAIFAATTLYLLAERGDPAATPTPVVAESATVSAARMPVSERAAGAATPPLVPPDAAPRASAPTNVRESVIDREDTGRQQMAERARKMLPDFDDPQKRRKMLEDTKRSMRTTYRDLDRYLGIGTDELDRLLELLAAQQVQGYEESLRCALDDRCRLPEAGQGRRDAQMLEVTALIGADKERRFEEFQMTLSERMSITALRGRFDDATRLTNDQAERLIMALAEVRQRAEGELALRGTGFSGFGSGVFSFVYSGVNPDADAALAEATEYGRRVHERAAQILDKNQLAIFDDARAESLRGLEYMLRESATKSR